MADYAGACHCGALSVRFSTAQAPEALAVRACQCSFCRKHDARAVSDPRGAMEILVHEPAQLQRYAFGLGETEFLLCRRCGVYVAAYMPDGEAAFANVMVNVLEERVRFAAPRPVVLDDEDAGGKRQRRRRSWTPAVLREVARDA